MKNRWSEFDARHLSRIAAQASAVVLFAALSACATKPTGSGLGAGAGGKTGSSSQKSSVAQSDTGSGAGGSAASGATGRGGDSTTHAKPGEDPRDPFNNLKNRQDSSGKDTSGGSAVSGVDGSAGASSKRGGDASGDTPDGAKDAYSAGFDRAKDDPVATAIAREQAARDAARGTDGQGSGDAVAGGGSDSSGAGGKRRDGSGTAGGNPDGANGNKSGTGSSTARAAGDGSTGGQGKPGDSSAGGAGTQGQDSVAGTGTRGNSGSSSSSGAGGQDGDSVAGAGAGGKSGTGSNGGTGSASSSRDADDPVKAAVARAEEARRNGGRAGTDGNGGAGESGMDGDAANGAAGGSAAERARAAAAAAAAREAERRAREAEDGSPVAEALRRSELARKAREEAERAEAERRGIIETASNRVLIDEDDRLQTLDGMLPMALNMDERGLFDFDRYELREEVKSTLDLLAQKLNESAYDKLHILGFADRIGTDEYNQKLSEKRAWAVAGYLMNKGVPPHKLRVVGRGEQDSAAAQDQCEGLTRGEMIDCLQQDRRVEIAATVKEYQLKVQ